jgi:tetratricopeptide (TPR) repeat protein
MDSKPQFTRVGKRRIELTNLQKVLLFGVSVGDCVAQIIKFPALAPKFGYKRVRNRPKPAEDPNQLHLAFEATATILNFESDLSAFEQALALDEREDVRAAEMYLRAIREQECVADAYCNLGIIQSRQGSTARAFESFTMALKQDARHFEAHFNLGNLYFDVDDFRLAQVHYEIAAGIDPSFPNVYFNLALVGAINRDNRAAETALSTYRQLVSPEEGRNAGEVLESVMKSLAVTKDGGVEKLRG